MKLLHSADWHLDSPIQGRTDDQASLLRNALLRIPEQVVAAAKTHDCDMILLSGDLFDGQSSPESLHAVHRALEDAQMPVVIAPGNHDYVNHNSPWLSHIWPENVHIFLSQQMESIAFDDLNCRVYGAAFTAAEAEGLLKGFCATGEEAHHIGVLHGDPTQASSPYCPVTTEQVKASGLDYLALGHIHKGGQLRAGSTLCAWPGCPMGRGFDETDSKGVYIVTLEGSCQAEFLPLDTPRFYDWECAAGSDPADAIAAVLPAAGNSDFYRITLTGECEAVDTDALASRFSQFPNLVLRDRTVPPIDLWASAGEDTLEGVYFRMLQEAMAGQDEQTREKILLAARISRQLLLGQEVKLP